MLDKLPRDLIMHCFSFLRFREVVLNNILCKEIYLSLISDILWFQLTNRHMDFLMCKEETRKKFKNCRTGLYKFFRNELFGGKTVFRIFDYSPRLADKGVKKYEIEAKRSDSVMKLKRLYLKEREKSYNTRIDLLGFVYTDGKNIFRRLYIHNRLFECLNIENCIIYEIPNSKHINDGSSNLTDKRRKEELCTLREEFEEVKKKLEKRKNFYQIDVTLNFGIRANYDVLDEYKIIYLKFMIVDKYEHFDILRQRLVFKGKVVEDGRTMKEYGVKKGDVFHLIMRYRGG